MALNNQPRLNSDATTICADEHSSFPRRTSESQSSTSTLAGFQHPYFDDDDDYDDNDDETGPSNFYFAGRARRRTFVYRLLSFLGMNGVRRRGRRSSTTLDYFATSKAVAPRVEVADGGKKSRRGSPREVRRGRRGFVTGSLKKAVLLFPVVALMAFGLLHILQVLIGRAWLFWDVDAYDEFLPDWGMPGRPGEGLTHYPTDATRDVIPIPCHSHNDYWRRVPLYDAIHWGCTGVEADVWLFDEELYVGHNTASLTRNRTFRNLYINPLREFLDKMNQHTEFGNTTGHGVFDEDPDQTLVLLVDFKTNGRELYPYVLDHLSALREKDYLSYYNGTTLHKRAITVVGTGNTPFDLIQSSPHREIFFDAPLNTMWEPETPSSNPSRSSSSPPAAESILLPSSSGQGSVGTSPSSTFDSSNSYYASVSFTRTIGFVWRGQLSPHQLSILRGQIRGAHKRGLKARYWDTPSWPVNVRNKIWTTLMQEGADVLNVDDLKGAAVSNWRARVHGFW